jgi:branched-chain amino acid transport system ATP-binding protein
MSALLSVKDARKAFGRLLAVDRVSFEVAEGEIYGIAGPNGAGKTTLFNLITGIPFHHDSGAIEFRGERIGTLPPHEIFRRGIARTFQKETAFDTLTVEQNVRVAAAFGRPRGSASRERDVEVGHALDLVGLQDERRRLAAELPLYAKKRLMLASAMVSGPALLMLDEPAAGLNVVELEQLDQLIRSLRNLGTTIVIIEHVLPLLFGISDRVMIMDSGQKIAEGAPESVAGDDAVIEAYLGTRGKEAFHAAAG